MESILPLPPKPEEEMSREELDLYEAQKVDVEQNRTVAAVSYIYVLSMVALFARRDSRFVQFHARQGAVLFCISLIALALPFWAAVIVQFVLFLGMAYGFVQAAQQRWVVLPGMKTLLGGTVAGTPAVRGLDAVFSRMTGLVAAIRAKLHQNEPPKDSPSDPAATS